jgi:hypothetical protein
MVKYLLVIPALLCALITHAQSNPASCDCRILFTGISQKIEQAYSGYPDKITSKTKNDYLKSKSNFEGFSQQIKNPLECHQLLLTYLKFFNDPNLFVPYISSGKLADRQLIKIDQKELSKQIQQAEQDTPLAGIWHSQDQTYQFAIIAYPSLPDAFVMIALKHPDKNWPTGTIQAIFTNVKQSSDPNLSIQSPTGYIFNNDFSMRYSTCSMEDGVLFLPNLQLVKGKSDNQKHAASTKNCTSFSKLNDSTSILQISSFNKADVDTIDSILRDVKNQVSLAQNLIIDLRGNRGGDHSPPLSLLKLFGQDSLQTPGWAYRVSKIYIDDLETNLRNGQGDAAWLSKFKNAYGNFWREQKHTIPIKPASVKPQRIAIWMDVECAHATEMLIYFSMQSPYVTTFGQPSSGSMDYSPSHPFPILCANIPFVMIPYGRNNWVTLSPKNETGLPPDVIIPKDQNGIKEILNYWQNKK